MRTAANREYLSVCRMTCNVGYEAVGSVERQCIVQGGGQDSRGHVEVKEGNTIALPRDRISFPSCLCLTWNICNYYNGKFHLYVLIFHLVRICEQLLPPVNGVIVGVCNRVYLSVCRMTCNVGYEAVGSVERQCVVQGSGLMTWTGQPWTCRGKGREHDCIACDHMSFSSCFCLCLFRGDL